MKPPTIEPPMKPAPQSAVVADSQAGSGSHPAAGGPYSVVGVYVSPGQEYAAIVKDGVEVVRADISDYQELVRAVEELNDPNGGGDEA